MSDHFNASPDEISHELQGSVLRGILRSIIGMIVCSLVALCCSLCQIGKSR